MDEKKRVKKPNWSTREVEALVLAVEQYFGTIKGRFSSSLCKTDKSKAWGIIENRVNSVSSTVRTQQEIRKKWTDMSSLAKKKEAMRRAEKKKTGGGAAVEESSGLELKVVSMLADEVIEGVPGGLDTFELPIHLLDGTTATACVQQSTPDVPAADDSATQPSPIEGGEILPLAPLPTVLDLDLHVPLVQTSFPIEVGQEQPKRSVNRNWMDALNPVVDFERERLEIDRERLALERERLEFEKMRWREWLELEKERVRLERRRMDKE